MSLSYHSRSAIARRRFPRDTDGRNIVADRNGGQREGVTINVSESARDHRPKGVINLKLDFECNRALSTMNRKFRRIYTTYIATTKI